MPGFAGPAGYHLGREMGWYLGGQCLSSEEGEGLVPSEDACHQPTTA